MGARSRSVPSAAPSHNSISRAVAAVLGSSVAPLPLDSRMYTRHTGPASERRNFPLSGSADTNFWLVRLLVVVVWLFI